MKKRIFIENILGSIAFLMPIGLVIYYQFFDKNILYLLPCLVYLILPTMIDIMIEIQKLKYIIKKEGIDIESYR